MGLRHGNTGKPLLATQLDDLLRHLKRKLKKGMMMENYGRWHIDHKIPLSAFHFKTPHDIDFRRAWALKNLQPMWNVDNWKKHDGLERPFQPALAMGRCG